MRADEQYFPIHKSMESDDVWSFSAFQIHYLLRATDCNAIFSVAKDYRDTADKLDRTAEELQRCAVTLASAWEGEAAGDALLQLRQYYASARALAVDARMSSAGMTTAAQALAVAQAKVALSFSDKFPSADPSSLESVEYQKILNDLNTQYAEVIGVLPSRLAIALPRTNNDEISFGDGWEDVSEPASSPDSINTGRPWGSSAQSPAEPTRSSAVPVEPSDLPDDSGLRIGDGNSHTRTSRPEIPDGPTHIDPSSKVPFVPLEEMNPSSKSAGPGTSMAGGSLGAGGETTRWPYGGMDPFGRAVESPINPSAGGAKAASGTPNAPASAGYLPGLGSSAGENARERRFFLPEDRDVWGIQESVPPVLYGDYAPRPIISDDDDF
jgi:uncharacterized protein YukE